MAVISKVIFTFVFQVIQTKNIFIHGDNSPLIKSHVTIVSVTQRQGEKIPLIDPWIPFPISNNDTPVNLVSPIFTPGDADRLLYHKMTHK